VVSDSLQLDANCADVQCLRVLPSPASVHTLLAGSGYPSLKSIEKMKLVRGRGVLGLYEGIKVGTCCHEVLYFHESQQWLHLLSVVDCVSGSV